MKDAIISKNVAYNEAFKDASGKSNFEHKFRQSKSLLLLRYKEIEQRRKYAQLIPLPRKREKQSRQ